MVSLVATILLPSRALRHLVCALHRGNATAEPSLSVEHAGHRFSHGCTCCLRIERNRKPRRKALVLLLVSTAPLVRHATTHITMSMIVRMIFETYERR